MIKQKDIKNTLDAFLSESTAGGRIKNVSLLADILDLLPDYDLTDYAAVESLIVNKFFNILEDFLYLHVSKNKNVIWIYKHSRFLSVHLDNLFWLYDGITCSHDKTKTVIKSIINFYETGEKIVFDYDQEYTFHLPKNVLTTHENVVFYYNAVLDLYYGRNEKYLKFLLKVSKK